MNRERLGKCLHPGAEYHTDARIRPCHVFCSDSTGCSGTHGREKAAIHDRDREPGIFIEEEDGSQNSREIVLPDVFVINGDHFRPERAQILDVCRHEECQPRLVGQRDGCALRHSYIPLGKAGERLLHCLHAHPHREEALNFFA